MHQATRFLLDHVGRGGLNVLAATPGTGKTGLCLLSSIELSTLGYSGAYTSAEGSLSDTLGRVLRSFPFATPKSLRIHSVATAAKQPRPESVTSIPSAETPDFPFVGDIGLLEDKEDAFSRLAVVARVTNTTVLVTVQYSRQALQPPLTAIAVLRALADATSAESRFFPRPSRGASHHGCSRFRLSADRETGMPVSDIEVDMVDGITTRA